MKITEDLPVSAEGASVPSPTGDARVNLGYFFDIDDPEALARANLFWNSDPKGDPQ